MKILSLVLLLSLGIASLTFAQTDSLVLINKDLIIGEIKSMDKGILTFETDYSDVDFKISWDKVLRVSSSTNYLITLSDGRRFNGRVRSSSDSLVVIDTYIPNQILKFSKNTENIEKPIGDLVEVPRTEVVYLNALDEGFWSRLSFGFDVGTNLTKANNFRQFTFNTNAGYLADRWKLNITFENLRSSQDEVEPIKRTEFGLSYNYFLPKDWYLLYYLNTLSNTEQKLDLRTSNMIGIGKYVIHSNQTYLGFSTGVNFNNEKFSTEETANQSGEAFIGVQYNIFNLGDLDMLSTLAGYPSLTEKGRFRTDFKFDIRYEFKFDLYFKIGTTINYDNQPAAGASDVDYVFQTTVGWKL